MSSPERRITELPTTHSLKLSYETNRNADITKELLREEETLTLEELLAKIFKHEPGKN